MTTYSAKCIDARYDETEDKLVLYCHLDNVGERIVYFSRSDFYFRQPGVEVPKQEMYKTADLFRGKMFKLSFVDEKKSIEQNLEETEKIRQEFLKSIDRELTTINKIVDI